MAKGENQKLKMLFLLRILYEETDDTHGLTMHQLIEKLNSCGVHADRKTLYQDLNELNKLKNVDIIQDKRGRSTEYHLGCREFELPELKLLVDSVQAAKFITDTKSRSLIHKLESLTSRHEAKQLQRQVLITGRVKSPNTRIYYSVDSLYSAIDQDRQVTFRYFQWNIHKERILRHDGSLYHVSPWCLMWDNEYYYLIGFDSLEQKIKHYRVDKMLDLAMTRQPREGKDAFQNFNAAKYSKSLFGMYGGEEESVLIEAENEIAPVFIDRFGSDIMLIPTDDGHFQIRVDIIPSGQFLGWIFGLGKRVKILSPDSVIQSMRSYLQELRKMYSE